MINFHIYDIVVEHKYILTSLIIITFLVLWHIRRLLRPVRCTLSHKEKNVLITGCDSGFGYNTALKLNEFNVRVFAGCYTQEGLALLKQNKNFHGEPFLLDVTSKQQIDDAFQRVKECVKNQGKVYVILFLQK